MIAATGSNCGGNAPVRKSTEALPGRHGQSARMTASTGPDQDDAVGLAHQLMHRVNVLAPEAEPIKIELDP
jgi:hypothetical protein